MYERFLELLNKHQTTAYQVAKATGISQNTFSDWKKGRSTPKIDKMQKIADYFGVTTDYLLGKPDQKETPPALTKKDERDIEKILAAARSQLENQEGLMFDGDPASPEAIESILAAMELGLQAAKQRNKEKYTPKKYRQK